MQPLWLCLLWSKLFETTFENAHGEKSNKCNQCDYASSWAGHLRRHLKTHNGEKIKTKVTICDYASSEGERFEETFENTFVEQIFRILFLLLKLEKRISISLSLLESGEFVFKFLFLFSKLENSILNFSISSRKLRFYFHFLFLLLKLEKRISISHSLLESWESFLKFLSLFSKLEKGISDFSFSSRNWRKLFQISLSLLDWTFWPFVTHWSEGSVSDATKFTCLIFWIFPYCRFLAGFVLYFYLCIEGYCGHCEW